MGIIDTSTLVSAERRKHNVGEILSQLRTTFGDMRVGVSVVTLVELAHGVERAKLPEQRAHRQTFLDDLITGMKIYPLTTQIARLASKISGQQANRGIAVPFEDLLIGSTALYYGCDVLTENIRHFEMIPGLQVRKQ